MEDDKLINTIGYGAESTSVFISGVSIQHILGLLSVKWENIILLAISSILPNKVGLRVGAMMGTISCAWLAEELKWVILADGYSSYLPLPALKLLHNITLYHKISFGIIGGVIGIIVFTIVNNDYDSRLISNVLAGIGSALGCGVVGSIIYIIIAVTNKRGHPDRFYACFKLIIYFGIGGSLIGSVYGIMQYISEMIGKWIKGISD